MKVKQIKKKFTRHMCKVFPDFKGTDPKIKRWHVTLDGKILHDFVHCMTY